MSEKNKFLICCLLMMGCFQLQCITKKPEIIHTEVCIIGGGASGTMAGIQAARMGVSAIIVEETPWLGGMLTSAGVSAIDGNYRLHSGLWEEFRQQIYAHYGGPDSVQTGWVSNVLFEPHVGATILEKMAAAEQHLKIIRESKLKEITKSDGAWNAVVLQSGTPVEIRAKIVIDATELGDVAKMAGITYDIGMDSRHDHGEDIAPEEANDIIQDLTYVAILKDYGEGADRTIDKPEGYSASTFYCTCEGRCNEDNLGRKLWPCETMMNYGRLPNDHYMINWPINGNDYYLNLIENTAEERTEKLKEAKNHTLQYVYYLQTELGFKHLSIADDVYPTPDGLPFIPYYRESRRIHGLVKFNINDLARPFEQKNPLYRTGIAVGDYPVDHHHHAYPEHHLLPDLHFYPVPSYSLPLGTLIPRGMEHFIVAEKSISVTNLVNGTTRLQPVCMLIGHAAGALAALAVNRDVSPHKIPVREVQQALIASGAYIMPYSDVEVDRSSFKAFQRIGATGMLKGEGKTIGWTNHTHIHPDSILTTMAFYDGLNEWLMLAERDPRMNPVKLTTVLSTIKMLGREYDQPCGQQSMDELYAKAEEVLIQYQLDVLHKEDEVTREAYAVLLDELFDPFNVRPVDHSGNFKDSRRSEAVSSM